MIGSINLNLSTDYFKEYHFGHKNNEIISSLINFCLNFQLNQKEIDYWSLKTIKVFHKDDLFHRHSLDVLLSLKKLSDKKELDSTYETILDSYKKAGMEEKLIEREKQLSLSRNPEFNKGVL